MVLASLVSELAGGQNDPLPPLSLNATGLMSIQVVGLENTVTQTETS